MSYTKKELKSKINNIISEDFVLFSIASYRINKMNRIDKNHFIIFTPSLKYKLKVFCKKDIDTSKYCVSILLYERFSRNEIHILEFSKFLDESYYIKILNGFNHKQTLKIFYKLLKRIKIPLFLIEKSLKFEFKEFKENIYNNC